jgi:hypothetical protein
MEAPEINQPGVSPLRAFRRAESKCEGEDQEDQDDPQTMVQVTYFLCGVRLAPGS